MIDYISSVKGAVYGFAIGDAMGASTEFMTKRAIAAKYGRVTKIVGGGWLGLEPGEVTDDTQMMLCVFKGMRDNPEDPLRGICKQFHLWLGSDPVDIGNVCLRAISTARTDDPEEWFTKSQYRQIEGKQDLGNGGLMRCLVPLLAGNTDLAVDQSRLTHNNLTCDEAVVLYGHTLQAAMDGRKPYFTNLMKPSGHAWNTMSNARYWFQSSRNFYDTVEQAVNDGGDADTIAALAGALAGAYYGIDGIPDHLIAELKEDVCKELSACCDYLISRVGIFNNYAPCP